MTRIKTIFAILFSLVLLAPTLPVLAQIDQNKPVIHFFWSSGCPYCLTEKAFLEGLEKKYPQIEIKQYEFSKNVELVKEFYQNYEVPSREQGFVPVTFTRDRYFVGFNEQIGREIERCIQECLGEGKEIVPAVQVVQEIKIPFLGEINAENFSIPALAIILGTLDGFNICSLGALVLILGLVLALKSKRKILIFGGVFILATVIVYGVLVFLWYQLFVFIAPHIRTMEILIGLLALVGAVYFLKEFLNIRKRGVVCQFGGISENLAQKIQKIFEKKASIFVLIGAVLLFAAIVTIIEFPCTAFFPVLFAGILADTSVPFSLSLFYIGLYILFYMLDEIIVLLAAAFTMKIWIASPKFVSVLNLFASVLLFLLGFYYLFSLL
ncbi:MAG: thioredoxin family protein [bacterium]|nr:thioredoxin family protein [bacterium]